MKNNRLTLLFDNAYQFSKELARRIPILKNIPAFDSIPKTIELDNLHFYLLCNLVLTLGMFDHFFWIFTFFIFDTPIMSLVNTVSLIVYIISIIINRRGLHFTSSVIMVSEIILHQVIAIWYFGSLAGFQYYIMVITLFPFLMPRGKWNLKGALLLLCVTAFVILDYFDISKHIPIYHLTNTQQLFLKISNTIFAFVSLALSGAYFTISIYRTEEKLFQRTTELKVEKDKSDELLLNILPAETANELKLTGHAEAKLLQSITIVFTDFKNFTKICEQLSATLLVQEIDYYFKAIDVIVYKYDLEKIKTIGDAYMCVAGISGTDSNHPQRAVACALEILNFMEVEKQKRISENRMYFEMRAGIHTGSVIAGVVGIKKFAYDIWGDAVNIASRMESSGEVGKINVSADTYVLIKNEFHCIPRGKILAKNKGEVDMYLVDSALMKHY